MNILQQSAELDKATIYRLTKSPKAQRLTDALEAAGGEMTISLAAWIIREEGESVIVSMMDKDGNIFATNSPTFNREFADIADIFGDDLTEIVAFRATSKNGRTYCSCYHE